MGANRTSFVKGDKRINRKGRPKVGESLAEKYRDALNEALTGNYTKLDSLIDKAVEKALKGDLSAIQYVEARAYGKLVERTEAINTNMNYDFSNMPLEERKKLLETLRNARRDNDSSTIE